MSICDRLRVRPHSIGTAEAASARSYIMAQCVALGLDTFSQHTTSAVYGYTGVEAGEVTNIGGVYRGSDSALAPGSAVLVMAHYDSQPNAVGAGDDGVGCASMLEVARLLRSRPRVAQQCDLSFYGWGGAGAVGVYGFRARGFAFFVRGCRVEF